MSARCRPICELFVLLTRRQGPWSAPADLAPAHSYTYLTQNAYDIPVIGTQATTYVYFGDRWNGKALYSSTYSFLPLVFNESGLSIHNTGGWTLDVRSGIWSDLPHTDITAAESSSKHLTVCNDGCPGGKAANMTNDQTFSFTWHGAGGDKVMQVQYTYLGPGNSFLNLGVTVNGAPVKGNVLLESSVADSTQQAPLPLNLPKGAKVVITLLDWNGDEVLIKGVNIYPLEPGSSVRLP